MPSGWWENWGLSWFPLANFLLLAPPTWKTTGVGLGALTINPNFWTTVQTWRAQAHETRRRWMDSSAWSQRGQTAGEEDYAWQGDQQSNIDFSRQAKWKFCTVGGPKFSKSFSKVLSEPFLKRRHYMQIFCCIAQILWASSSADPLLLVARSNHRPAPCLARCFWHNLYDCLLSITFHIVTYYYHKSHSD